MMGADSSTAEKIQSSNKEHLLKEYANLPEILGGLTSLVEETEDYTCLTLKKIMGRREKGYEDSTLFSPVSKSADEDRKTKEMI